MLNTYWPLLREVEIIHAKGTIITNPPKIKRMYSNPLPKILPMRRRLELFISHPILLHPRLKDRYSKNDQEQDPG